MTVEERNAANDWISKIHNQIHRAAVGDVHGIISDLQETITQLRSSYLEAGSINVRSVSGSKRFCIATGSTVTITSSVGDTYAARTWPARVVPSGAPTTMCVWTTGFA